MARNTSVSLGDHFSDFVQEQVASGRYATASDVLRAGLRLLEYEEAKLDRLRELIAEGIEDIDAVGWSGNPMSCGTRLIAMWTSV